MNLENKSKELPIPKDDGSSDHLKNLKIPSIALPNQDGHLLKLNRSDTFRIVLYCYPMTGSPNRLLPDSWNLIPGASGCTSETCSIRDNYDQILNLNAIPIGITTQSFEDIKEMVLRLKVNHDVLSDIHLDFANQLKLPTFKIENKVFLKRLTLIIEKSIIKKTFYPIFPANKHIYEVIEWLKKN